MRRGIDARLDVAPKNWPDETDPSWWLNRLRVRAQVIARQEACGESTEALRNDIEDVARQAVEAGTPPVQVEEALGAIRVLVCGSRTWQDTVDEARGRGIPVEVCALGGTR